MMNYLIVQKIDDEYFVYREDENHFNDVEKSRKKDSRRLKQSWLDESCDLSDMPDNSYIVFNINKD